MSNTLMRQELGEFSSIVCFKALITGMEEALGEKSDRLTVISCQEIGNGERETVDLLHKSKNHVCHS